MTTIAKGTDWPRKVILSPTGTSTQRYLLLDHDGEFYRVAWYEQRRRDCDTCKGRGINTGGPGVCKACHGRGWSMPMTRTTGRAHALPDAISWARGELRRGPDRGPTGTVSLDSELIADYIWSTPWGSQLPGAETRPLTPEIVEYMHAGGGQ